jgi:hypothetical protein
MAGGATAMPLPRARHAEISTRNRMGVLRVQLSALSGKQRYTPMVRS